MTPPNEGESQREPVEFPGWELLAERRVVVNAFLAYRLDHVRLPSGTELPEFAYIDSRGAALIVPVTADGHVLLIRQYRHNLRQTIWEVPAGGLEPDETPEQNAEKELREEIGGVAASLEYVSSFFTSAGSSNAQSHVFLARGVTLGQPHPEEPEQIAVVAVPIDQAMHMARSGVITNGPCALALLLCEPLLLDSH
jgi:ADP-ribose pyrophosphatase